MSYTIPAGFSIVEITFADGHTEYRPKHGRRWIGCEAQWSRDWHRPLRYYSYRFFGFGYAKSYLVLSDALDAIESYIEDSKYTEVVEQREKLTNGKS